jgi:hypothetical protein
MVEELYKSAHIPVPDRVHVGGDQLTRVRFSTAKLMMLGALKASDRLGNLGPITCEFFHLAMNFLQLCVDVLYSKSDAQCEGSMKYFKNRLNRTNFKADVKAAYDEDADFFTSFGTSYGVAAIMEYFGLDTMSSAPTRNAPPSSVLQNPVEAVGRRGAV